MKKVKGWEVKIFILMIDFICFFVVDIVDLYVYCWEIEFGFCEMK